MPTVQVYIPDAEYEAFLAACRKEGKSWTLNDFIRSAARDRVAKLLGKGKSA